MKTHPPRCVVCRQVQGACKCPTFAPVVILNDIRNAFCLKHNLDDEVDEGDIWVDYEHGQWWVMVEPDTAEANGLSTTYSVVDTSNGLDFEEL